MTKELKPILDKEGYAASVEKVLIYVLFYNYYKPLFNTLNISNVKHNKHSKSLQDALDKGVVWYSDNKFQGTFNANISRTLRSLGAKFNRVTKSFDLKLGDIPLKYKLMIQKGNEVNNFKIDALKIQLDKNIKENVLNINLIDYSTAILTDLNQQFLKGIPKDLSVPMETSSYIENRISEEYTENVNLAIRNWTEKHTIELRNKVVGLVNQGYRSQKLAEILIADYGVAKRKAKFIAKQETSLLTAKYREVRYTAAGIDKYQWVTVHDNRVRHDHKLLDGQVFGWGEAVIDSKTGQKGNPGEAFGCRCTAKAILE